MSSSYVGIVPGSGVTPLSACEAAQPGNGFCATLQAAGGNDQDLLAVATGADPSSVLNVVMQGGHYGASAASPVSSSLSLDPMGEFLYAASGTSTVDATSSLASSAATAVGKTVTAAASAASNWWTSLNWTTIILVIVAVLAVLFFAFGAGLKVFG